MFSRREFLLSGCALPATIEAQAGASALADLQETTSLNGPDWRLGSFPFDGGEQQSAFEPGFDDRNWKTVAVPGEVQVQLGFKGMDLYYQRKELTLANEREWWYRKRFQAPPNAAGRTVRLTFEGVDYFAAVWLNGHKLGEHEGAFVPFTYDVSSMLFPGENVLAVKVTCPWLPKGRAFLEYIKGEYTMSSGRERARFPFPPYLIGPHFGIPAGGNAVFPMGLWRDVNLVSSGPVFIENFFASTKSLETDGSARLVISGTAHNRSGRELAVTLDLRLDPENFTGSNVDLGRRQLTLAPGENPFQFEAKVDHPRLWWSWDLGEQNLYRAVAIVTGPAGTFRHEVVTGIRTIRRGEDMSYWLNGKRLFLKGAWYWQGDWFGSTVTRALYEQDLVMYRACNLNHLVAFCYVEKPDFYDLCDRLGILVLFEFPFNQFGPAEALGPAYPRQQEFVESSLHQVRDIIFQLRTHPSIILWSFLAEAHRDAKGWNNGQDDLGQYGYEEYSQAVGKLVAKLAPGAIYHPSLCDQGEHHFWMASNQSTGSGNYAMHFYANAAFVSEYGAMSVPPRESLEKMIAPGQAWSKADESRPSWGLPIDAGAYAYITEYEHDALAANLDRTKQFVDREIKSLPQLLDAWQLYQAFVIQYATEAYRRKKYNSINGTRIWCYGDPYPCISWSFVDYYRVPKMAYWFLKRAQERLSVNFAYREALESQPSGKRLLIPVWLINDHPESKSVAVECEILDLGGRRLWKSRFETTIKPDAAALAGTVEWVAPETPGVYVLRAAPVTPGEVHGSWSTTFIKVTPRLFSRALRVLVIGQREQGHIIAEMVRATGAEVSVIEERNIRELAALANFEDVRSRYDIVWLASFDSIWKMLTPDVAGGLKQAIAAGAALIHTGGPGSFHGGRGMAACLEFTELAEVLPVTLRGPNDLIFGPLVPKTRSRPQPEWGHQEFLPVKDIALAPDAGPTWAGLEITRHGVAAFHDVGLKPGARLLATVSGHPLLIAGRYGKGRVVAFAGFMPAYREQRAEWDDSVTYPYLLDQELVDDPATRPYFDLVMRLLSEAAGQSPAVAYDNLIAKRDTPLFQTLSGIPGAAIKAPDSIRAQMPGKGLKLNLVNGAQYARLVRIRTEWDEARPDPPYILYSDNYFDMFPGERKELSLEIMNGQTVRVPLRGRLLIEGSNLARMDIPLEVPARS